MAEVKDRTVKTSKEEVVEDVIDKIQPSKEPKEVELSLDGDSKIFVQSSLSYFGKIEFFGLLGRSIEEIVDSGVNINSLFGGDTPSAENIQKVGFNDLEPFVSVIAKLASHAPEFLKESYLIWLAVPPKDRAWARDALDRLSDEKGEEILLTFIDQNLKDIEDFFTTRRGKILKKIREIRGKS